MLLAKVDFYIMRSMCGKLSFEIYGSERMAFERPRWGLETPKMYK
jgi:hypothetical protein